MIITRGFLCRSRARQLGVLRVRTPYCLIRLADKRKQFWRVLGLFGFFLNVVFLHVTNLVCGISLTPYVWARISQCHRPAQPEKTDDGGVRLRSLFLNAPVEIWFVCRSMGIRSWTSPWRRESLSHTA